MKLGHNFNNLKIWQKSIDLAVKIFEITKSYPVENSFGITLQKRGSSVGIPSNRAEGSARNPTEAFSDCLNTHLDKSHELKTRVLISHSVSIFEKGGFEILSRDLSEVQKMMTGFHSSLEYTPS